MNHDDELLASYVAGDTSDGDESLRELFTRRPELREHADELRRLARSVETSVRTERDVIAEARGAASVADRARVASALRGGATVRRPFGWRRLAILSAAAVVVVGSALYLNTRESPGPQQREFLGGPQEGAAALAPQTRSIAAGVALTWTGAELAPSERWKLEFFDARDPARRLAEPVCSAATWTPTSDVLTSWPESVRLVIWRVEAGPHGSELARSPEYSLQVQR